MAVGRQFEAVSRRLLTVISPSLVAQSLAEVPFGIENPQLSKNHLVGQFPLTPGGFFMCGCHFRAAKTL